jgi:hypothetical protein
MSSQVIMIVHNIPRGNLSAIFLKNIKLKFRNEEAVEDRFACLPLYLRTRGYSTPTSTLVHTSYINVYVIKNKLVLS